MQLSIQSSFLLCAALQLFAPAATLPVQDAQSLDITDRSVAGTATKDILTGSVAAGIKGAGSEAVAANPGTVQKAENAVKSALPRDIDAEAEFLEARQLSGIVDAATDAAEAASDGASLAKAGASAAKGSKSSKSVAKNTEKNQQNPSGKSSTNNTQSTGEVVATPEIATREQLEAALKE